MVVQTKLKGILVEKCITQTELASIIGQSREMVNRKLNGKNMFTLQEAFEIADYLGLKVDDIFLKKKFTQTKMEGRENGS